jgi:hypothetical protein
MAKQTGKRSTVAVTAPVRRVPRPFAMPWGSGQIAEEASTLTPWHEPTIQLLEYEDGSTALRFCYYHGPRFGRGPMMVDEKALDRFAEALQETPRIRALLRRMLGEQP